MCWVMFIWEEHEQLVKHSELCFRQLSSTAEECYLSLCRTKDQTYSCQIVNIEQWVAQQRNRPLADHVFALRQSCQPEGNGNAEDLWNVHRRPKYCTTFVPSNFSSDFKLTCIFSTISSACRCMCKLSTFIVPTPHSIILTTLPLPFGNMSANMCARLLGWAELL